MPPGRISLTEELAERVAFWQSFFDCFRVLWFDSAEFECWAKVQLEDPKSPVNQRALAKNARYQDAQIARSIFAPLTLLAPATRIFFSTDRASQYLHSYAILRGRMLASPLHDLPHELLHNGERN